MVLTDNFIRSELENWKDSVENEKMSILSFFKIDKIKNSKIKSINDDTWFVVKSKIIKKTMREYNGEMHYVIRWDNINIPLEVEDDEFNRTLEGDNYLFVFHKKAVPLNGMYSYEDVILKYYNGNDYDGDKEKTY